MQLYLENISSSSSEQVALAELRNAEPLIKIVCRLVSDIHGLIRLEPSPRSEPVRSLLKVLKLIIKGLQINSQLSPSSNLEAAGEDLLVHESRQTDIEQIRPWP